MYTAEELSKMSTEELEKILKEMKLDRLPTLEELKSMNVGIYDEDGGLIGEKEGGEY